MKNIFGILLCLAFMQTEGTAQTRHLVKFKNKGTNPFSLTTPSSYLSARSIARRTRYGIALDSTDLPVTPRFIDSLRSIPNVTVLNVSKWLNQVSISTSDPEAIARINAFTFVQSAAPIASRVPPSVDPDKYDTELPMVVADAAGRAASLAADFYSYGLAFGQIHIHNGEFLHNIGLRGQTMIIGMLDAGYLNYLTVKAFDSVRANGQILGTYDFVANETSVNEDNSHGMQCLSTIAANIPGQFVGTAPKSSFYLFRTEDAATEYPIEEHNWVCGAERLDSAGGDVISSSLGYYYFDAPLQNYSYAYAQMNGNSTMSAIGADLAAKKGVLVVNSAGNSGNDSWKYIITPADGDSVLAVGAVNTSGVVGSFSSYGPSSDGQVKPDVAAVGVSSVVQFPNNTIGYNNGTSFAAPNMAGLATCLWQGFPEVNNMRIINALRQAGSIAASPNDRIGYGIPDVKKALVQLTKEFSTASGTASLCKADLNWTSKDMSAMKYEIERKIAGETAFTKIGERPGSGAVFGTRNYTFSDPVNDLTGGSITYRIRQVFDTSIATFTADYIDTLTVALSTNCTSVEKNIVLLPNPAKNALEIRLSSSDAISTVIVKIRDVVGKEVMRFTTSKGPGTVLIPVQVGKLARGKYYVSVYSKNGLLGTSELLKL